MEKINFPTLSDKYLSEWEDVFVRVLSHFLTDWGPGCPPAGWTPLSRLNEIIKENCSFSPKGKFIPTSTKQRVWKYNEIASEINGHYIYIIYIFILNILLSSRALYYYKAMNKPISLSCSIENSLTKIQQSN